MPRVKETWKPVPGFEDYYAVSNYCRLKRLETVSKFKANCYRTLKEKILNPTKGTQTNLCVEGNCYTVNIKKLAYHAFKRRKVLPDERLVRINNRYDSNYIYNFRIA